jgi:hypothetical protein
VTHRGNGAGHPKALLKAATDYVRSVVKKAIPTGPLVRQSPAGEAAPIRLRHLLADLPRVDDELERIEILVLLRSL